MEGCWLKKKKVAAYSVCISGGLLPFPLGENCPGFVSVSISYTQFRCLNAAAAIVIFTSHLFAEQDVKLQTLI